MPGNNHPTIREASASDIPEILRQRRRMYEDMDYTDPTALKTMVSLSSAYLTTAMAAGSFRAWLATYGDRVAAGGAVVVSPWPATRTIWNAVAPPSSTSTPIPNTAAAASPAKSCRP